MKTVELNEQQQLFANTLNGYICCVACPGSGKSTSILARANNLVRKGALETEILLMTFTKEAALHMAKKYEQTYGKNHLCFGTIHSICFKALRELRNLDYNSVITENEKIEFLGKSIKEDIPFNERADVISEIISQISYCKNKMITPEEYKLDSEFLDQDLFIKFFNLYESYKNTMKKIDFDDMLLIVNEMLYKEPSTIKYFHKWKHIMVDEYQDTNKVQSRIIEQITLSPHFGISNGSSLAVVGDDDQSIYGFRSADSSIMLDFEKLYPNSKILKLDINYRSAPEIVEAAGKLIKHNTVRFDKNFRYSKEKTGLKGKITVQKFQTALLQDTAIINELKKLEEKDLQEVAVLYRTNRQGTFLAGRCAAENIPFYSTENLKNIHDDRVFQDILCYFRLSHGITSHKGDILTILNRPSRYLLSKEFKNCKLDKDSMLDCCASLKNKEKAVENVEKMFSDFNVLKKINEPSQFVTYLFDKMGYAENFITNYAHFIGLNEDEAREQIEIIRKEATEYTTMSAWFTFVEEFAEKLKKMRKNRTGICLSTYHASKGLEWDCVYLIDVNDGITPFTKAVTLEEIEEERRMFYVAFTRARKQVKISFIQNNDKEKPSQFIEEMGLTHLIQKSIITKEKKKKIDNTKKVTQKYYVVCKGRTTGVFKTLKDALQQIDGFENAFFKSFSKKEDADAFYENKKNGVTQNTQGKKVYAVKEGHNPGIYNTWKECQKQIDGYKKAKYRVFSSMDDAIVYLKSV